MKIQQNQNLSVKLYEISCNTDRSNGKKIEIMIPLKYIGKPFSFRTANLSMLPQILVQKFAATAPSNFASWFAEKEPATFSWGRNPLKKNYLQMNVG